MKELQHDIAQFAKDRPVIKEWQTPIRVATFILEEALELLQALQEEEQTEEVMSEIADVQFLLATLANMLSMDLEDVTRRKINRNNDKFPSEELQNGDYHEKMKELRYRWNRDDDKTYFST